MYCFVEMVTVYLCWLVLGFVVFHQNDKFIQLPFNSLLCNKGLQIIVEEFSRAKSHIANILAKLVILIMCILLNYYWIIYAILSANTAHGCQGLPCLRKIAVKKKIPWTQAPIQVTVTWFENCCPQPSRFGSTNACNVHTLSNWQLGKKWH